MILKLGDETFTTGRATFLDRAPAHPEPTAKIFIKLKAGDLGSVILAQLDTGSPWSVLEPEIADAIGLFDSDGEPKELLARGVKVSGQLVRAPVVLVADDGESLEIDATVFVSRDWSAGNFVGYSGLLESIRIALDAQTNHFYFGAAD
jgi:predicted aspartyl protease